MDLFLMQIIHITEMRTVFQNRATKMSYVIGYDTTISDLRQVDGISLISLSCLLGILK